MEIERDRLRRFRAGHRVAAERRLELMREEGPDPEQAVAEALGALDALAEMGLFPGPRDPVSERGVEAVRRRWTRIQLGARATHRG